MPIKVIPPLTVEPPPAEHAQQSNRYTSPEWWLVWVTLVLAAITAILAGYTAKLWGATKSLAEDAKQTATRQASEMQKSLGISQESADTARASVALAREEFRVKYRPRVIVRAVSTTPRDREIEFVVANIGDTKATIIEWSAKVWLPESLENLPASLPYGGPDTSPGISMERCEAVPFVSRSGMGQEEYGFRLTQSPDTHNKPILFIGYLIYEDITKRKYVTAFIRSYDFGAKRFQRIHEPDHEYQE